MIADHLLSTGSIPESPSNASRATPQSKVVGTVVEQRCGMESEHVVPEQPMFPLLGNETPGRYVYRNVKNVQPFSNVFLLNVPSHGREVKLNFSFIAKNV